MDNQNFDQNEYRPPINEYVAPQPVRPGLDLKAAFSSGLFLALCILMTIATVFGTFTVDIGSGDFGVSYSFNIIHVLIVIGMWITYGAAKSPEGAMKKSGFNIICGSLFATRILNWIAASILVASGIILAVVGVLIPEEYYVKAEEYIARELVSGGELDVILRDILGSDFASIYPANVDWSALLPVVLIAWGIVMALIAVVMMILNILYYKKLHYMARSLYACVDDPYVEVQYANAVSVWLLVLGILNIFSGLSGVVMILGYVFIKKQIIDRLENYTVM
ncbi:MAG: hypothetical protein IJY27_07810 [Clostridia bacterium]|nr:hypothetical protein [Clostridia bacterium]